jgi:hydroxyacylglutathione hydrolase
MGLQVEQFMCRSDNFGILIRDEATGTVGLVDAPEEGPIGPGGRRACSS